MTPPIPYGRHTIDRRDTEAIVQALRSDWLTTGPAVAAFERDLEAITGAPTVAVSSGTAALHCAYAAIGLSSNAELITTPLTFAATVSTALHVGASVKLVDVVPDALTLDPDLVERAITPNTAGVTTVDYGGHPSDLRALRQMTADHGIYLLEDASHALGATYFGQPVGSLADITTFSFHPVKPITTAEGGAVSSTSAGLSDRARSFRNHGLVRGKDASQPWYQEVESIGLNYRLPDVLAALGSAQLTRLQSFIAARTTIAARYDAGFAGVSEVRRPIVRHGAGHGWHLYVIRVPRRARRALFLELVAWEVQPQVHYVPIHYHRAFRHLGYDRGTLPNAEAAYAEMISLPIYPSLSESEQSRVIECVRNFFGAT